MIYTHLDLFTGLGGFSLAAEANGIKTIGMCEIEKHCRKFLAKVWPGILVHKDIKELDGTAYFGIYLLTAGVPCQPASRAGKQRGAEDYRWLWPEALRVFKEAKPAWAIFENPPGIGDIFEFGIQLEVDSEGNPVGEIGTVVDTTGRNFLVETLEAIEAQGYDVQVFSVPACAVGAPHQRERYWIVGHSEANERRILHEYEQSRQANFDAGRTACNLADSIRSERRPEQQEQEAVRRNADRWSGEGYLADTDQARRQGTNAEPWSNGLCAEYCESDLANTKAFNRGTRTGWRDRKEFSNNDQWSKYLWLPCADGKLRRAPDDSFGLVDGLHRSLLAALGNSIVPQVAYQIIKAIKESKDER